MSGAPADTLRARIDAALADVDKPRENHRLGGFPGYVTGLATHDVVGLLRECQTELRANPAASSDSVETAERIVREYAAAIPDHGPGGARVMLVGAIAAALTAERRARDELTEAAQAYSDVTLIQSASNPDVAAPTCAEHERLIDVLSRIRAARAGDGGGMESELTKENT